MSTVREQAIEAGARAVPVAYWDEEHDCIVRASEWDIAAAIVDAVEPIIRADQDEKRFGWVDRVELHHKIEAEMRERLREQVEALPIMMRNGTPVLRRFDVLALLDGEPNG
jgi:hypothetical protein